MVESGFDRTDGCADRICDIGERQPCVVMEGKDRAMLWCQAGERAIERVSVID